MSVTVAADAFVECQHLVDRVVDALLPWRGGRAQRPVDVTAQAQEKKTTVDVTTSSSSREVRATLQ